MCLGYGSMLCYDRWCFRFVELTHRVDDRKYGRKEGKEDTCTTTVFFVDDYSRPDATICMYVATPLLMDTDTRPRVIHPASRAANTLIGLFFCRDCCIDSCVDGQYDCDRSIFNCKDPDSAFSHFCGVTSDNDGQSGATLYSEDLTTIESETRAHVCANCNPIMENFFHTIGEEPRCNADPECLLHFLGECCAPMNGAIRFHVVDEGKNTLNKIETFSNMCINPTRKPVWFCQGTRGRSPIDELSHPTVRREFAVGRTEQVIRTGIIM